MNVEVQLGNKSKNLGDSRSPDPPYQIIKYSNNQMIYFGPPRTARTKWKTPVSMLALTTLPSEKTTTHEFAGSTKIVDDQ